MTTGDDNTSKVSPPQNPVASTSSTSISLPSPSRHLTNKQKREVRAAMCSLSTIKALDTGIPKEVIEIAIKERLLAGNGKGGQETRLDNSLTKNKAYSTILEKKIA